MHIIIVAPTLSHCHTCLAEPFTGSLNYSAFQTSCVKLCPASLNSSGGHGDAEDVNL